VDAPGTVKLSLRTLGLAFLIANSRDGGQPQTPIGRLMIAAGTIGTVGPVVALSLLLSQRYRTRHELGFLPAASASMPRRL
jgi:hypothetical protein